MLQKLKIVDFRLHLNRLAQPLMAGVLLVCLPTCIIAGDDLRIRISTPNNGRIRSHATLPIEVDIKWNNDRLLEGYVEIRFREASKSVTEQQTFYTYRTPDLALSFGEKKLGALLPTAALKQEPGGILTFDVKFVGTDETIDLGSSTLITPTIHEQRLLIGVVLSDPTIPEERTPFVAPLHFKTVFTNKSLQDVSSTARPQNVNAMQNRVRELSDVITRTERIDVMELPPSAHRLCAYDLLIVADDSFPKLSAKQLDALATWIEAGGNALIELESNGCNRSHLDFLNRLANSLDIPEQPFLKLAQGRIDMADGDHDPTWDNARGFQAGLGRAVVFKGPLNDSLNQSRDGTKLTALVGQYLWHRRANPRATSNDGGQLSSDTLNKALMPDSVRSVPAASVITMLLIFLLTISVGDYFLLGLIGKRTWTWVLFPLISLGFTGYTVWMARHYMGASDFTTAITIIDTDTQGRVLRSSRIEMLFTAAERVSKTKIRNAIFAPLSNDLTPPSKIGASPFDSAPGVHETPQGFMRVTNDPPLCIGQLPAVYSIERRMRKWTPQISRYTTLGAETETEFPEFSWNVSNWNTLDQPEVLEAWKTSVFGKHPNAQVRLIRTNKNLNPQQKDATDADGLTQRWRSIWEFVRSVSTNGHQEMYSVAARISPTGGAFLNDLATIDSTSQAGEFAAVVILRRGEEFFVFRHTHFGSYLP